MNKRKYNLDLMQIEELVNLSLNEEEKTIKALRQEKSNITRAINLAIKTVQQNGRIIYMGAGTSGRLGMLDAAECRPTFGTDLFCGIIAGGKNVMFKAKEGAEDNQKQAVKDLNKIKISTNDVLVGISASGTTPYVISGIRFAKKKKIKTIGITTQKNSELAKLVNFSIVPGIENEIILGSSRLKSGTAQKIILNMISSISMIKTGKVYRNLMIDVQATNKKLINRAIGIISMVCNISLNNAKLLFKKSKGSIKAAIVMQNMNCSLYEANNRLKAANYDLRKIIG